MIHKVWREEYEGLTTGLELPVRGDIVNGHRHSLRDVEDRLLKLEGNFARLAHAVEGLINEKDKDTPPSPIPDILRHFSSVQDKFDSAREFFDDEETDEKDKETDAS